MRHGHVTPNEDGSRARCGGPGICTVCNHEYFEFHGHSAFCGPPIKSDGPGYKNLFMANAIIKDMRIQVSNLKDQLAHSERRRERLRYALLWFKESTAHQHIDDQQAADCHCWNGHVNAALAADAAEDCSHAWKSCHGITYCTDCRATPAESS